MKTVLNLKNVDTTKQPLFLGEPLSLQRYDRFKYPVFFDLFKKQVEFRWWPHEIALQKDRIDYQNLSDCERFIFDNNLRFQTLGDSVLSRSIHALSEYVSNPELEAAMNEWASMEGIHSYSYSYILNNVYPDATKFFDSIMEDKEIVKRANLIRNSFDKILGDPGGEKDIREKILNSILAVNCMEGLVFPISFACTFWFGYKGKMVGNSSIIKFLQRDESVHFAITQNIIKLFHTQQDEGFSELIKSYEPKVYAMWEEAIKNEAVWADYLFSKGSLLGLNKETLIAYGRWLADNRLRSMGYKTIFGEKFNPLSGWLDTYLDSSKVQVAPQETEILSYKLSSRDTNIKTEDFSDISL